MNDLTEFAACLEIVKFAGSQKHTYADVILNATKNGVTLKAASKSGTIMSTVQIKPIAFKEYKFFMPNEASNPEDEAANKAEFCIPFLELKHIVDSLAVTKSKSNAAASSNQGSSALDAAVSLQYPMGDGKLGVLIIDTLTSDYQNG